MWLRSEPVHRTGIWGKACWLILCLVTALPSTSLADATRDTAVAQLVVAIIGYTQFPVMPSPIRVCIVGATVHGGALGNAVFPGRQSTSNTAPPMAGPLPCDVLYLGQFTTLTITQGWVRRAVGKPVVTIAEDDPGCHSQAMFCLAYLPDRVSFRLNIDAISRSTVRIDPRVLRVSEGP
jgi:hypothetical protein